MGYPSSSDQTPVLTPSSPTGFDSDFDDGGGVSVNALTNAFAKQTLNGEEDGDKKLSKGQRARRNRAAKKAAAVEAENAAAVDPRKQLTKGNEVSQISLRLKKGGRTTATNLLTNYFGDISKLGSMQKLCHFLGIEPTPFTITQCKKELQTTHVNIWDLVDAILNDTKPETFTSANQLAKYTRRTGRFFPITNAKDSGVVRYLLVRV